MTVSAGAASEMHAGRSDAGSQLMKGRLKEERGLMGSVLVRVNGSVKDRPRTEFGITHITHIV